MIDMKKMINFLKELENNNNKEWFHEHKEKRLEATKEFENLVEEIMHKICEFDPAISYYNPKDLTFKLVRDTRFSNDKSPYNPVFRAHIAPKGKLPVPVGYFISLRPNGGTVLGGGIFADMFKDATTLIRDYITDNGEEFSKIITKPEFTDTFKVLGTKLKKVPKGYDENHKQAEYLKHKSWFIESYVTDKELLNSDIFIERAIHDFKVMKPFNDYLNKALINFEMPKR
ncbi:MAG: DUF2461 domain-containing protein [Coprobacillaceae bacterium]